MASSSVEDHETRVSPANLCILPGDHDDGKMVQEIQGCALYFDAGLRYRFETVDTIHGNCSIGQTR